MNVIERRDGANDESAGPYRLHGFDGMPDGIQTVADYQKIGDVLARRGYTPDDVANVLYRNWTRFYTQGLPG